MTSIFLTKQPEDLPANPGDKVVFSLTADYAVSYQWYYSKDGGKNWVKSTAASGTTPRLTVNAAKYAPDGLLEIRLGH